MEFSLVALVALEREAKPFIELFAMQEQGRVLEEKLNFRLFISSKHPSIGLVLFGECPRHKVERIGTNVATIAAMETIRVLQPQTIASVGTAGGFRKKGACIGDVFYGETIYFHDRHMLLPRYRDFECGVVKSAPLHNLGFIKCGVVSSGDSIPIQASDQQKMLMLNTDAKDMEAAAIAEVATLYQIPMFALKAITDFVDVNDSTEEQFNANYFAASQQLARALQHVIEQNGFIKTDSIFSDAFELLHGDELSFVAQ